MPFFRARGPASRRLATLAVCCGGRPIGVEVKWADAPAMTNSMHVARADLKLDGLWVVYPVERKYARNDHN